MTVVRVESPGANLHTEVAGAGPALLMIPGGGGDAGMYSQVVPLLAERFTVITYDRRGNSRSRFTGADEDVSLASQVTDVIAVLDHHAVRRAHVFGNSGGALIALELLARHPDRLLSLVAHEPPAVSVLSEDSSERRELEKLISLGRAHPLRAYAAFGAMIMTNPPWLFRSTLGQSIVAAATAIGLSTGNVVRRITRREPGSMTRQLGNADLLMRRELPTIALSYRPDEDALRTITIPWRLAVGQDSAGKPYYEPALVLSRRVGAPCEVFPGGHTLYIEQPDLFCDTLQSVIREMTE